MYYIRSIVSLRYHFIDGDVAKFRPGETHAFIRQVEADSLAKVYRQMQGFVWSPNGEARDLIRAAGVSHTSMSVGDVVVDADGHAWVCADRGWIETEYDSVLVTRDHDDRVSAYSKRNLTELERYALAAWSFLIPKSGQITLLEFAREIEEVFGIKNEQVEYVVTHLGAQASPTV